MRQIALDIGLWTGPTLDNFVPGPNQAVLEHLQLWLGAADSGLLSPVPTYLWGTDGCGKSHLLRAVREALRMRGASVGWMDASTLHAPDFDEHWACVLMDDVHLYTAEQQHAAFNWFVNAQAHQRSVLSAGSVTPLGLALREDLRTRLGWGHVFGLQLLSEAETRSALRQTADARGVFLRDEVMDYMLKRFSRDLGSLMELLDLLDRYALQTQRPITIPLLKSMMDNE
ncbi:DnaA regulatory inactivator Hda [Curvibacter sp. CHRR-16]|uniref:DnaA regulatory inactivator Hda n=1 Tax=Curvibacter sp. CHRR-16 TaxID=2835872 RepID=UPI001BD95E65|nr:DnaA regulatory inactivator Hda [Curvibacter sp. CHRR-16]MBT0569173.1 DnaA regulatory inactivator Hda [Curvibacter sp. CHRR-16]